MAVTEWSYNRFRPHIGNSEYFVNSYEKKTKRFEHLQCSNYRVSMEKHVLKHISEPFQASLIF